MSQRKTILFIAASLDGYIATQDEDLSFLSIVDMEGEDYGYEEFIRTVDTVIMGRKTYDWIMNELNEYPHPDKDSYIITRTSRPDMDRVKFYTGSLNDLIRHLKLNDEGKNIFIDGGAEVIDVLLKENLIDEFIISIIPILLGDGIRLFKDGRPESRLKLMHSECYGTGLVQLHYKKAES
ncbi:MAG TPA: dihydrofolate reductase family protein [Bacteroidales bacterium]|jgi:dihydrofolate reductase|nr:dihydrofolate reductase family protein [Bacteroidales bacterium]